MLNKLNEQQQLAVDTVTGPLLILAGAGSGKTRVLTYRIAHLIESKLAHPENILAVTFTNKAAGEMKERIKKLLNRDYALPWMGTFHSICVKILRRHGEHIGISSNFSIYDTDDQLSVVKDILKSENINEKQLRAHTVLNHISASKNDLVGPEEFSKVAYGYLQEMIAAIYPRYQNALAESSALDFDDLIMQTVRLFQKVPQVLLQYQEMFKFILIDEYQDTNHAQYMFSKLLAEKSHNICVVGDDAQSIYGFRGATIENILNFERDYPETKIIKLEQNYRSTQTILDASNSVISKNKNQKQKKLWTENGKGESIEIYEALDEKDEANWIADLITEMGEEEVGILYRTNAQSRAVEEALLQRGLPYRIYGGVEFYSRKEVKDMLAYMRILYNPNDMVGTLRIINVPRRGIGAKAIAQLGVLARQKQKPIIALLEEMAADDRITLGKGINDFALLIKVLKQALEQLPLHQFITFVFEESGYYKYLNDGTPENDARIENVRELISVARKYSEEKTVDALRLFLEEIALIESSAKANEAAESNIYLMTIHSAKGLEFDNVIIPGMEEGLFPHSRTYLDPAEMEEERRLAYVAITRARKKLYMSHAQSRTYFGSRQSNPSSRFIDDIPQELLTRDFEPTTPRAFRDRSEEFADSFSDELPQISIEIGEKVRHQIFGIGKVVDFDDSTITIEFPIGKKELSREFARLEKI